MSKGDLMIGSMADEVIETIETYGATFYAAFAKAAHARGIWHHLEKERYNTFFGLVRTRVSGRNNPLLKLSMTPGVTKSEVLALVSEQAYMKSPDFHHVGSVHTHPVSDDDPHHPRNYEDNHGFIHDPNAPYLPEAPC